MTRRLEPLCFTAAILLWTFAIGYDAAGNGHRNVSLALKGAAQTCLIIALCMYVVRRHRQ